MHDLKKTTGSGLGSPDMPALSSSIPRDSSNLVDSGCRGSSMDLPLLPASRRAGTALLVVQKGPLRAGVQAALCRVLLERAGKEHPPPTLETQGSPQSVSASPPEVSDFNITKQQIIKRFVCQTMLERYIAKTHDTTHHQ